MDTNEVKKILEKQLELLSERSENEIDNKTLVALAGAIVTISVTICSL